MFSRFPVRPAGQQCLCLSKLAPPHVVLCRFTSRSWRETPQPQTGPTEGPMSRLRSNCLTSSLVLSQTVTSPGCFVASSLWVGAPRPRELPFVSHPDSCLLPPLSPSFFSHPFPERQSTQVQNPEAASLRIPSSSSDYTPLSLSRSPPTGRGSTCLALAGVQMV